MRRLAKVSPTATKILIATGEHPPRRSVDMARKKIVRGPPPLSSRLTLKAKEHKGAQLLEILRGIAIKNRQEEPQVFYPIREVARRFAVTVSTVSRVYGELEEEGILVSVRG